LLKHSLIGFVLFPDPGPPHPDAFGPLVDDGFRVARARDAAGAEWALDLSHDAWGRARLGVMKGSGDAPPVVPSRTTLV
jgi:hypothetical protein